MGVDGEEVEGDFELIEFRGEFFFTLGIGEGEGDEGVFEVEGFS